MNESIIYTAWVCFVIATPCLISGITSGFASISLPQLNLDLDAASWFGSINIISALFGCILSGSIIDRFGRKPTLVISILLGVIGWFLLSLKDEVTYLFLGRCLTGLSNGATFFPTQIYAGECTDKHPVLYRIRGSFTLFATSSNAFGFFLVSTMGAFWPYYQVAFISFVLSVLSGFLIMVTIPESPVWLYHKGKLEQAKYAQKVLHVNRFRESEALLSAPEPGMEKAGLKRRDIYVPLYIITALHAILSLSGCGIFTCYLVELIDIENSTTDLKQSYMLSIGAAFLAFFATICEIFVVPFMGVRKILIVSSSSLGVCLAAYGLVNIFTVSELSNVLYLIGVIAVWTGSFFASGMLSMTKALIGEIFPVDGKRYAAIPTVMFCVVDSFVMKLYPYLIVYIGGYTFVIYAFFSVSYALYVAYFIPETVGKTMHQIRDEFVERTYF